MFSSQQRQNKRFLISANPGSSKDTIVSVPHFFGLFILIPFQTRSFVSV